MISCQIIITFTSLGEKIILRMNISIAFTHYRMIFKFSLGKGPRSLSYRMQISTGFLGISNHSKNSYLYTYGKKFLFSILPLFLVGCTLYPLETPYSCIVVFMRLLAQVPFHFHSVECYKLWAFLKVGVTILS